MSRKRTKIVKFYIIFNRKLHDTEIKKKDNKSNQA